MNFVMLMIGIDCMSLEVFKVKLKAWKEVLESKGLRRK